MSHIPVLVPRSAVPEALWPAIPNPVDSFVLGMLSQLEVYDRLSAERLRGFQLRQLGALVEHAVRTVPWYRRHYRPGAKRWRKQRDLDAFRRFPLLTGTALRRAGRELVSAEVPKEHGRMRRSRVSRAARTTVDVLRTDIMDGMAEALYLRHYLAHGLDLSAKTAYALPQYTVRTAESAVPWAAGYPSGPLVRFGSDAPIDEQIAWLSEQRPTYLLTLPSNLLALARRIIETGVKMPWLKGLRSEGAVSDAATPDLCRQAFGLDPIEEYGTPQIGPIALPCPERGNLHVCSETVLVEVLKPNGSPCSPGETGRVVVTVLQGFAMPLVRYELGDRAEPGGSCPCGRGHPTLRLCA